jgi:pimeloyl-ACP methyl ester carboxylesterase
MMQRSCGPWQAEIHVNGHNPLIMVFMQRRCEVNSDSTPIYLIPGMSADYPVYSRVLPLLPNAVVVDFIPPEPWESLVNYASRMANLFPTNAFIGGVSFGGIIALEISRILRPRGCILISSVRHPRELPPWFRVWRVLGGRSCSVLLQTIGSFASVLPKSVCTSSTIRATRLAGSRGHWHRWATAAVIDWQPELTFDRCPILQIHGTADTTFPIRYIHANVTVPDGRHALPISHPEETAMAIRAFAGAA